MTLSPPSVVGALREKPKRIQRKRTKGWRMPEGAVYVGRSTKWGNPFTPNAYWNAGYSGSERVALIACVVEFRAWLKGTRLALIWNIWLPEKPDLTPLRGKDLACWCPLDQPCHADVLLEMANAM